MTAFLSRRRSLFALTVPVTWVVIFGSSAAFAQTPVTPGDILVYRVGTGSAALTSAATQVYLDEYTTSGTLVQSIMVNSTVPTSGNDFALTASGTATSEGGLTVSPNGEYVALTGYDAGTGVRRCRGPF